MSRVPLPIPLRMTLAIVGVAFFVGILTSWGFTSGLKITNRLEFCVSCHTMRDNIYVEYQESSHYKNRSGIRVECSDCHVPKDTKSALLTKGMAIRELYHHLIGTVDTPEKFEQKRWQMANKVWDEMRKHQSRECRSCHDTAAMVLEEQSHLAQRKHERAIKEHKTCIDCHQGVVHKMPSEPEEIPTGRMN